jgi:flagellar basal-body rod protein FlgF
MIYGLYLSASGVIASSHRQDVVANNLANAETTGFKRDVPLFQQRLSEAEQRRTSGGPRAWSDDNLENIGGGLFVLPSSPDLSAGVMERTDSALDVAIEGDGYFAVRSTGKASITGGPSAAETSLTRNGQFMVDRKGFLVLGTEQGQQVLDINRQPIRLSAEGGVPAVGKDGTITQDGEPVGRIGVFNVADRAKLIKQGGTLLSYAEPGGITRTEATLHGEFLERSNVDPTSELTELMKAQRLLEANANMIRYQDQTLQKLVNEVGKIA